jgi:hypothetical protein
MKTARGVRCVLGALAVAGAAACNSGPCPSTVNTEVFPLVLPDGGDAGADGGCMAACSAAFQNSLGWTSCAFTTEDGGAAVSCTGPIETCP